MFSFWKGGHLNLFYRLVDISRLYTGWIITKLTREEFKEAVVIHDVGHYFGLSDKRPRKLEREEGREWHILKIHRHGRRPVCRDEATSAFGRGLAECQPLSWSSLTLF